MTRVAPLAALTFSACFALPPNQQKTSVVKLVGVEVTPGNGTVGATENVDVSVGLGEALDPSSLSSTTNTTCQGTVQLSADDFMTCVPGTVTINGTKLVFTTAVGLMPGTTYTIRITVEARDAKGNQLTQEIRYTFTTDTALGSSGDTGGTGGSGDTGNTGPFVTGPTCTPLTTSGSSIRSDAKLSFLFSESMQPGSEVVLGTIVGSPITIGWSTKNVPNDVLVVSPSSLWPQLDNGTIAVTAMSVNGVSSTETSATYTVLDGIIYVDQATGADAFSGSLTAPKKSIQAAIAAATMLPGPWLVKVALGTYNIDSDGNPIRVPDGVSLKGGFSSLDWSLDPGTNRTIVIDTTTTAANPATMEILASATAATQVSNFELRATSANLPFTAAMICSGSATIKNNVLKGKGPANGTNYGLYITGQATPLVESNQIFTSNANEAVGIRVDTVAAATIKQNFIDLTGVTATYVAAGIHTLGSGVNVIEGNTIIAGGGGSSYAVYSKSQGAIAIRGNLLNGGTGSMCGGILLTTAQGGTSVIEKNAIEGGTGITCRGMWLETVMPGATIVVENNLIHGGGGSTGGGISLNDATAKIHNNTIDAGTASGGVFGITLAGTTSPDIVNNLIFSSGSPVGGDFCVFEYVATSQPGRFMNNDLFDCTTLYQDHDGSTRATIGDVNSGGNMANNVSVVPGFADADGADNDPSTLLNLTTYKLDANWGLTAITEASTEGLNGALQVPAFGTSGDYAGMPRTATGPTGWSMGAYEKD